MAILPLRSCVKHYSGSQDEMATGVVEHVKALIANKPDED